MILNGLLNTIRKIYLSHNIVLWIILVVLPIGVSLFTMGMFSSQIVQHVPIGIVKQDDSRLADRLEMKLRSSPVLDIKMMCADMSDCEHAVVRGDIQASGSSRDTRLFERAELPHQHVRDQGNPLRSSGCG